MVFTEKIHVKLSYCGTTVFSDKSYSLPRHQFDTSLKVYLTGILICLFTVLLKYMHG